MSLCPNHIGCDRIRLKLRTVAISIGLVYIILAGLFCFVCPKLDLYDDRLEYHDQSIAYDDIETINKIINSDRWNPTVRSLSDPDAFEQAIGEQIIDPSEQYRRRNEDYRAFWQLWPSDCIDRIPEHGIVQESELADALGVDVSARHTLVVKMSI